MEFKKASWHDFTIYENESKYINNSKTQLNETLKSLEMNLNNFNKQLSDCIFDRLTENMHKLLDEKYQKLIYCQKNFQMKLSRGNYN
jgi:hypothetical protein